MQHVTVLHDNEVLGLTQGSQIKRYAMTWIWGKQWMRVEIW